MRVVAYVRVSTDQQADKGLGLEIQEKTIRSWAKAAGHKVVTVSTVSTDAGVSGAKDLDERDGLGEVLELLRGRQADGVAVYRLDRLARDLVVQEQLLAEIWRVGGEVWSTASGEQDLRDDPDDPSRRMIRQILGAVSEYERSMITLRLKRGRAAKAAAGGYAYGAPPYGRRADAGGLLRDDAEAAAIERMGVLRQQGRSLRDIVAILDAEGVPSKRGGRWHPQTVANVLARA